MRIRYLVLALAICVLVGGGYYYARTSGLFGNANIPYNPPTKEDLRRLEEIERSSATIAPDAVPGAGVRPRGSLPRPTPEEAAATSTDEEPAPRNTTDGIETEDLGETEQEPVE